MSAAPLTYLLFVTSSAQGWIGKILLVHEIDPRWHFSYRHARFQRGWAYPAAFVAQVPPYLLCPGQFSEHPASGHLTAAPQLERPLHRGSRLRTRSFLVVMKPPGPDSTRISK